MEIGKSRALRAQWFLPRWVTEKDWNRQELTGRLAPIGAGDRTLINAVQTYVSRPADWPWFSGMDGRITLSGPGGSIIWHVETGQSFTSGQIILRDPISRPQLYFQGNWYDLTENNPDNRPNFWWESR